MGRGSSKISGGAGDLNKAARDAIKNEYPDSVIGDIDGSGDVTFKFKDTPRSKTYTYHNIYSEQDLAKKLGIKYQEDTFDNSFFGAKKMRSNKYFEMDTFVSKDGKTVAYTTGNATFNKKTDSMMLPVSNNQAIFLKDSQWRMVGVKSSDGNYLGDTVMVKMSKGDFEGAKRYTFKSSFGVSNLSFDDMKEKAKTEKKWKHQYAVRSKEDIDTKYVW